MVMSAFLLTMRLDQLFVVHPVEMVAGEDQVVLRLVLKEVRHGCRTASAVP